MPDVPGFRSTYGSPLRILLLATGHLSANCDPGRLHEAEHEFHDPAQGSRVAFSRDEYRLRFGDYPAPSQYPVVHGGVRVQFVVGAGETLGSSPAWVTPRNRLSFSCFFSEVRTGPETTFDPERDPGRGGQGRRTCGGPSPQEGDQRPELVHPERAEEVVQDMFRRRDHQVFLGFGREPPGWPGRRNPSSS